MSRKKEKETWDDQGVDEKMDSNVITSDSISVEQEQFQALL